MTKIFLLRGEHHSVPGLVIKAFSTKELATAAGIDLANVMLQDLNQPLCEPGEALSSAIDRIENGLIEHAMGVPLSDLESSEIADCRIDVEDTFFITVTPVELDQ